MLQRVWYRLSFRTQLVMSAAGLCMIATFTAGFVTIVNARYATELEMRASVDLAERLVRETVRRLPAERKAHAADQILHAPLSYMRHVRIQIFSADGAQLAAHASQPQVDQPDPAPSWFASLVEPEIDRRRIPFDGGGVARGHALVTGEPSDEIAEVWYDVSWLAIVWSGAIAVMLGLLWYVLGRLLDPLLNLARGIGELKEGDYTTRLKPSGVREIGSVAARFNTLAEALDGARAENGRLYRHLIDLQEEERRQIANELHDEAGPCLFGITANASSIARMAPELPNGKADAVASRVAEILSIAERLKSMNRELLKKLRPIALGRVSLSDLLDELVAGVERRHPEVRLSQSFEGIARSYGEAVDLTLFRCVQEGLTNAVRHGHATNITVLINDEAESIAGETRSMGRRLRLHLSDDGVGIPPNAPVGFGLAVMRERVGSVGGSCVVQNRPPSGTAVDVVIPIDSRMAAAPRRAQTVEQLS